MEIDPKSTILESKIGKKAMPTSTLKFNGFLNHRSKSQQGWGYTAFGRVIDGMNIVGRISLLETGAGGPFPSDVPTQQVIIQQVKIVTD